MTLPFPNFLACPMALFCANVLSHFSPLLSWRQYLFLGILFYRWYSLPSLHPSPFSKSVTKAYFCESWRRMHVWYSTLRRSICSLFFSHLKSTFWRQGVHGQFWNEDMCRAALADCYIPATIVAAISSLGMELTTSLVWIAEAYPVTAI